MKRYGTLRAYSEEAACDMVLELKNVKNRKSIR